VKAVSLPQPNTIHLIETPDPMPGQGEAVIRIVSAGVCANDVALIAGNNSIGKFPIIPGHECIGVIESVGPNVNLEPGTWVTVYPSVGCGHCCACKEGRINHCPTFCVHGIDLDSGCFAEKMLVRADQLLPVPESLRHAHGALIEPTAVAVHVNKRGQTKPGSQIIVIGAGVIGLLTALVARAMGATRIALVDRLEERRTVCAQLGFDEFLCTPDLESDALVKNWGSGFDLIYDTVCSKTTVNAGINSLLPGGTLVLIATPKTQTMLEVDFPLLYRRELSLVISRNYVPQDFIDAMDLLETGQINLEPLVTAHYSLEQFSDAIHALQTQPERHIKILIHPQRTP
jgi:2-desacetyl-2-hydroxyethyl bacteriochlorophyllide A dehydrogenase